MIAAIDIGSSFIKGGLISAKGELLVLQKIPTGFDTARWLTGLQKIFTHFAAYRDKIRAIAVCGNGPTLVPVDNHGEAVSAPLSWIDPEGEKYYTEISGLIGDSIDPRYYLSKVYAFSRERPELYAKTTWFLPCPEFINYFLTGNAFAIRYCRGGEKYLWNAESLEKLGLDKNKFPPFTAPGTITGKVTVEASRALGLSAGIPVAACGTDFLMTLIGTAAISPGQVCDRTGTSEGLNLCTDKQLTEPRLLVMQHLIPGYFNVSGILPASGKALEWIKNNTYYANMDYPALIEQICAAKPAADNPVFLPFLLNNRSRTWEETLQGAFVGLKLEHSALHLARAVVESTGFAMLDILHILEQHSPGIKEITVSGSITAVPAWNQLRADILGRTVLQPRITDCELTGAACLGMSALGEYADIRTAVQKMVNIRAVFEPNNEQAEIYRALYTVYRYACRQLRNPAGATAPQSPHPRHSEA